MTRHDAPAARHWLTLLAGGALAASAAAQDGNVGTRISPSLAVEATYTDNRDLSATDRKSELITRVSPGVHVDSRGGRVRGSLDYSLDAIAHASRSSDNRLGQTLSAVGVADLIDNHLSVDARASIQQQSISAFGARAPSTVLTSDNQTQVATMAVSPTLRGLIAGVVELSASVNVSATRAASTNIGDGQTYGASLGLSTSRGNVGLGLSMGRTTSDYFGTTKLTTENAVGSLNYTGVPDTRLTLRAGWNGSDVQRSLGESGRTWGWGAGWQPSPRTSVSWDSDHQYYGGSHTLSVTYRMPRTVLAFTDSQSVSQSNQDPSLAGLRTQFANFYNQCIASGNSASNCDLLARYFVLGPNFTTGALGFLSSGQSLQRNKILTAAYAGQRTTYSLTAAFNDSRRLEGVVYTVGDLAVADAVRLRTVGLSVLHNLTPSDSLALSASQSRTLASDALGASEQRTLSLSWSASLTRRSSGSLTLRHVTFDSDTSGYHETGLVGSWSLRF